MNRVGTVWDRTGSHAIAIAHSSTPGQGMVQRPLNKRWCFTCQLMKPTKGGKQQGSIFRCADCLPGGTDACNARGSQA